MARHAYVWLIGLGICMAACGQVRSPDASTVQEQIGPGAGPPWRSPVLEPADGANASDAGRNAVLQCNRALAYYHQVCASQHGLFRSDACATDGCYHDATPFSTWGCRAGSDAYCDGP